MEVGSYLVYGVLGLFILLAFCALFAPLRWALKTCIHVGLGFLGLLVANVFGSFLGVTVGVNLVNTFVVALLGPAGVPLLLLLSWGLT